MQLQPRSSVPPPPELATGLAACRDTFGQRPAVTQLGPSGRSEQGFVTLAQWAAKGSHLLLVDAMLQPGDRVLVDVPPSWPLAAVCAAVWWAGGVVVTPGGEGPFVAAVVHASRPVPPVELAFVVGDDVDGGASTTDSALPEWASEVQLFPDQPPAAAATPDGPALIDGGRTWTHAELVATWVGSTGSLGVDTASAAGSCIAEVAARPLVTGRPTVVLLDGTARETAAGDRVTAWA